MCSTALLRWHGDVPTRPDREHDFAVLKRRVEVGMVLSPPQQQWFDAVQDPDGKKLVGLRNAAIHRYVRQGCRRGDRRVTHCADRAVRFFAQRR